MNKWDEKRQIFLTKESHTVYVDTTHLWTQMFSQEYKTFFKKCVYQWFKDITNTSQQKSNQKVWLQVLVPLPTNWESMCRWLYFSEPHFSHPWNGNNDHTHIPRWLCWPNEIMNVKGFINRKCSIKVSRKSDWRKMEHPWY